MVERDRDANLKFITRRMDERTRSLNTCRDTTELTFFVFNKKKFLRSKVENCEGNVGSFPTIMQRTKLALKRIQIFWLSSVRIRQE